MKTRTDSVSVLLSEQPPNSTACDTVLTHQAADIKVRQVGSGAAVQRKQFLTGRMVMLLIVEEVVHEY